MKDSYAEAVAEKIINQLEEGTAPWTKPWNGTLTLPVNGLTSKEYQGMNSVYLLSQNRTDPRWLTYNQAKQMDLQVRQGEKGIHLEFWKFYGEKKLVDALGMPQKTKDGKFKNVSYPLKRPICKKFVVFNGEQIKGLEPIPKPALIQEWERHDKAELLLKASEVEIIHMKGDRAYYSPLKNRITLPEKTQFKSKDLYYSTALHELGHSTGHESRLNRDLTGGFGSENYAKEELRAEIFSMMMGAKLQIGHDPSNHASYINSWIQVLKKDPREIFRASADASKMKAYILEFSKEKSPEKEVLKEPSKRKESQMEIGI